MPLTLAHNFLFLALHPNRTAYRTATTHGRDAGLIGSILLDLALKEQITIKEKRFEVKGTKPPQNPAHKMVWQKLSDKRKTGKLKSTVRRLAQRSTGIRYAILEDLRNAGLITLEDKRFLFIPYKKANVVRTDIQDKLAKKLHDILMKNQEPDEETAALLSLVSACRMDRILSSDRAERKLIRKKLKVLLKENPVASDVRSIIEETQAAVIAATAAAATASTAAAGS